MPRRRGRSGEQKAFEPTDEQVAHAVSRFTRQDLTDMRARMREQFDELLGQAKDTGLPFRVRRTAASEARVRRQQLDLYAEIGERMVAEDAVTVGDLGELAVARLCGYGAESDEDSD